MSGAPYDVLLGTLASGGQAGKTLPDLDHQPEPWESSMQATCECLSWRGALDNLERRHAEDELGETVYNDFPVRARSAVVTAHALIERGIIAPDELQHRMNTIRQRFHRQ